MSSIRKAKWVIKDLKKQGYEAYMVGGAVRDHLLKKPTTDIDITTNAKPHQVAKIFKTKPTGLKYGTVTVFMNDETFEVTTYRVDGEYSDNRHPEEVLFCETVQEDVMRRDFTINGILMAEDEEIIDYVDGQRDLKLKIIQTIGDPIVRFSEDALRIMRAFYFQSKLGFQITKETRDAISFMKERLNDISMERILNETIKIIKGEYVGRALQSMVKTNVHQVLPGLEKGLEHTAQMKDIPFVDAFFTLCFTLHGSIPKQWPFSNKHRHRYETARMLVVTKQEFDPYTLYTYGIDLCLLANRVNYMLKRTKNLKDKIELDYNELAIQSVMDLKLRAREMIQLVNKKAGAWVKNLQHEMVNEVLNKRLKNEKEALKEYVLRSINQ